MKQVVQARCPGCRNVLRVPADWIGQSIRCKHCGKIIQAKKKAAAAPANGPVAETNAGEVKPRIPASAPPPSPAVTAASSPEPMPAVPDGVPVPSEISSAADD